MCVTDVFHCFPQVGNPAFKCFNDFLTRVPHPPAIIDSDDVTTLISPASCRLSVYGSVADVLTALALPGVTNSREFFGDLHSVIGKAYKSVRGRGLLASKWSLS